MALLEKDLLHKHGNLRSGPQHIRKKPGIGMRIYSPVQGYGDR